MLAQGFLRVKGQAQITKCYFLWVDAINMQSLSGHYLMRQQEPIFLLKLRFYTMRRVYLITYVMNAYSFLLATSIQLQRCKDFSFLGHF